MTWIYFAIAAPALFSVTNFIEKFLVQNKIKDPLLVTIFAGLTSLVIGLLILISKGFHVFETKQLILILISGILLDLYLIPYYIALTLDDTSRVAPLFQFAPIFVLTLSYLFLGETLSGKQIVGFVFIIIGGFALSAERIEKGIFKPRKSLWFMLISSLLYAITGILFKFVVVTQDFWLTIAYETIGIGLGAIILLLWPSNKKRFQQEIKKLKLGVWGLLFLNQGFNITAIFFTSYAISLAPVALVSVISGIQPFFVLIYGLILSVWFPQIIKEDIDKGTVFTKLFAIILIFIGVYFVYLG